MTQTNRTYPVVRVIKHGGEGKHVWGFAVGETQATLTVKIPVDTEKKRFHIVSIPWARVDEVWFEDEEDAPWIKK